MLKSVFIHLEILFQFFYKPLLAGLLLSSFAVVAINQVNAEPEKLINAIFKGLPITGLFLQYIQYELRHPEYYAFYVNLGYARIHLWLIGFFLYSLPLVF